MSAFSESSLIKRLAELNNTANSIQHLSLWVTHHKKHIETIVRIWYQELGSAGISRKLSFLYLANDVVQNGRKWPEVVKEFGSIMKRVFNHLAQIEFDEKTIRSIARLLSVWEDRQIFEKSILTEVNQTWKDRPKYEKRKRSPSRERSPHTPPLPPPVKSSRTTENGTSDSQRDGNRSFKSDVSSESNGAGVGDSDSQPDLSSPYFLDIRFVQGTDTTGPVVPLTLGDAAPDTSDMIGALQDLENAASTDEVVRERIAALQPNIDLSKVTSLTTKSEAKRHLENIQLSSKLLDIHNQRLELELVERRRVSRMMVEFLHAQKDLIIDAEDKLKEYSEKLDEVRSMESKIEARLSVLSEASLPKEKSAIVLDD